MYGTKKIAKSTMMIMMFLLASKVLGFLRDVLIASKFGSGLDTDAYFVASTACNFIIGVICIALSTTLVPIISGMQESTSIKETQKRSTYILHNIDFRFLNILGNKNKIIYNSSIASNFFNNTNRYMNNILNITILFALFITIITWISAPLLIKIFAKGFQGKQFTLSVSLTRIGVPMIIFMACNSVFSGFLQGNEKFNTTAAIGIPYNMVFIIFLMFFSKPFGIKGLMVASIFAVIIQFILQLYASYKIKYSYKMKIGFKDKDLINTFHLILPLILGSMAEKINTIIDKTLASELTQGSISALNYSNTLNSLIVNIFVIGITTVIYPILSKEFVNEHVESAKIILKKSINVILIIIIPTTIGIVVLSVPIVELLYERGAFDSDATRMTSLALVFYSFGLIGISFRNILNKTFYSFKDTKTPMKNSVLTVGINIILNLILVRPMSHIGLALATSIAEIFGATLLITSLRKKIGSFSIKYYTTYLIKLGISAGVMGTVIYFINAFLNNMSEKFIFRLILLVLIIFIGAIIYLLLCYVFGIKEVKTFLNYLLQSTNNTIQILRRKFKDK